MTLAEASPFPVILLPLFGIAWIIGCVIYFVVGFIKLGQPLWRRLAPAVPVLAVAGAAAGLVWRVDWL